MQKQARLPERSLPLMVRAAMPYLLSFVAVLMLGLLAACVLS